MTQSTNEIRDVATERAVLGLVLGGLSPGEVGLPSEAFTGAGRHIWDAMLALHNEPRKIDHLTVCERLLVRNRLEACGGPAAIMALERAMPQDPITGAQDATGLPGYLEILRDRMQRRAVVAAADLARAQAMDLSTKPLVAAAAAVSSFGAIRGERRIKRGGELVYRLIDKWEANRKASAEGRTVTPCLPWPHEGMDTGIPRGRVSVVAGRSGNFKTGLVSDGMYFWAKSMNEPGGLIGLEDGCDWFMERLTGRAISVPYEQVGYAPLDAGQQVSLQNWCGATHNVLEERVQYEDYSETGDAASSISFPEVFGVIQHMTEAGAKWVVIDHGLRIDWMKGAQTERYDMAIGQGMARCSRYAERTGVAIIFLWHLNRAQQEGTVPQRSDLKESGYVDAEARKIYVLWKQAHRQGVQLVTTVKATKGEEGVTTALPLTDAVYGLLARKGGYRVDFEAEAAEAKRLASLAKKERDASAPRYFDRRSS